MNIRETFLKNLAQTTDFPMGIEVEKAEGNYIFDTQGKKYLDLISGISVSNVGHRHPRVVAAITEQVNRYMHVMVYGEYVQSPQVLLAQAIVDVLGGSLDNVYLTNSGTEAIEGALKLAKRYTGRVQTISFKNTYHGSTMGALSIMGNEQFKQAYRPLIPGNTILDYNCMEQLDKITNQVACVVVEGIQAEGGYIVPSTSWIQALSLKCKAHDVLLIFDEIQTGIGRTGKWFSFQHYGIVPDIVCMAKGLGGGLPIGAFAAKQSVMSVLKKNPILGHITTFGGNPVCAAAALAVINAIKEQDLMSNIAQKELLFRQMLVHPKIKHVSGKGLMLAVELQNFEEILRVISICLKEGLITDWFLFKDNALRIAPPLTTTYAEIENATTIILAALDQQT